MKRNDRRDFLKKSALGVAALHVPFGNNIFASNILGANDRLNVGVIGCNGMGWANTKSILKNEKSDVIIEHTLVFIEHVT